MTLVMTDTGRPTMATPNPTRPAAGSVFHSGFGRVVRYRTVESQGDDEQATAQTLSLMRTLALEDAATPTIQAAADAATMGARDERAKAQGIFEWVRRRVRFTEDSETAAPLAGVLDPADAEVLIRPVDLLKMRAPAGDCDDFATLTAALLLAAGIEPQFVTIAADHTSPNYSHVYTRALLTGGPLALDTSHGPRIGWQARPTGKAKTWSFHMRHTTVGALPQWGIDLLNIGAKTGAAIATERYAQPPAGTYRQDGNSVYYRQQPGAGPLTFPGGSFSGSGSTLLLVGAVVVAVVLIGALKR